MNRRTPSSVTRRDVILVASSNALFVEFVRALLIESGFDAACCTAEEPAWLAVTRTQPFLVVADCDEPGVGVRRIVAEAAERRIPLLLSHETPDGGDLLLELGIESRVEWFRFPITGADFRAALGALLGPADATVFRASPVAV